VGKKNVIRDNASFCQPTPARPEFLNIKINKIEKQQAKYTTKDKITMIDNHNPNAALPTPLTKTNPKFRKTNKPLQMCPQLTRTTNARSPGRASPASGVWFSI